MNTSLVGVVNIEVFRDRKRQKTGEKRLLLEVANHQLPLN
jgi:hypothetical protein